MLSGMFPQNRGGGGRWGVGGGGGRHAWLTTEGSNPAVPTHRGDQRKRRALGGGTVDTVTDNAYGIDVFEARPNWALHRFSRGDTDREVSVGRPSEDYSVLLSVGTTTNS